MTGNTMMDLVNIVNMMIIVNIVNDELLFLDAREMCLARTGMNISDNEYDKRL